MKEYKKKGLRVRVKKCLPGVQGLLLKRHDRPLTLQSTGDLGTVSKS